MKLIVCIDDNFGVLFNNRRLSSDKKVTERICEIVGDNPIYMTDYSAKLFADTDITVKVAEDLDRVKRNSYVFYEGGSVEKILSKIDSLIVFRWNRKYPSDVKFPLGDVILDMKLENSMNFCGNSHPEITEEVYVR